MKTLARIGICFLAMGTGACKSEPSTPSAQPTASAKAKPKTPDRLAPGELAEGKQDLYGLKIPAAMKIEGKFSKFGRAVGRVRPEDLSNYVRERVNVQHVEIAAERTVFPNARIKAGDANRVYRIEVIPDGKKSRLVVRDITKPKAPVGLSEAEMRRRAGLTPDGKQLDPKNME